MSSRSPLDRLGARLAALAVLISVLGALTWIHRGDLWPPPPPPVDPNDPFALCFAERGASIEQMVADQDIDSSQAALFKSRAEALCRDQAGGNRAPAQ